MTKTEMLGCCAGLAVEHAKELIAVTYREPDVEDAVFAALGVIRELFKENEELRRRIRDGLGLCEMDTRRQDVAQALRGEAPRTLAHRVKK